MSIGNQFQVCLLRQMAAACKQISDLTSSEESKRWQACMSDNLLTDTPYERQHRHTQTTYFEVHFKRKHILPSHTDSSRLILITIQRKLMIHHRLTIQLSMLAQFECSSWMLNPGMMFSMLGIQASHPSGDIIILRHVTGHTPWPCMASITSCTMPAAAFCPTFQAVAALHSDLHHVWCYMVT